MKNYRIIFIGFLLRYASITLSNYIKTTRKKLLERKSEVSKKGIIKFFENFRKSSD